MVEEGLNGRTTDVDYVDRPHCNGRTYFPAALMSHHPLDVVVVMLGSNDLKACFERTAATIADALHGYVDDVATYVTDRDGRGAGGAVAQPDPRSTTGCWTSWTRPATASTPEESPSRARWAAEIRRVAAERGVLFADAASVAHAGGDGLHLTVDSHPRLAALVAGVVQDMARLRHPHPTDLVVPDSAVGQLAHDAQVAGVRGVVGQQVQQHAEHRVLPVAAPRALGPPPRLLVRAEPGRPGRRDVRPAPRQEPRHHLLAPLRWVVGPRLVLVEGRRVAQQHVVQPEVGAVLDVAEQPEHRPARGEWPGPQLVVGEAGHEAGHPAGLSVDPVEDLIGGVHVRDVGASGAFSTHPRRVVGVVARPRHRGYVAGVADPEDPVAGTETVDYRLAAAGREAAEDERLDLLEQIYDPTSRRRRALVQPGWRCLEVGAGRGSMAVWLAEQVGPTGHVVATDVDTRYLSRLEIPNLEVIEHNVLEDPLDALGPGSFDLVCSRLMLFHLRGRQERAIEQMAGCLRPGGWLVDEDADWRTAGEPVDPAHPRYDDYHRVWRDGDWWTVRGYDKTFGRRLPALFERCGLEDVHAEGSTEVVRGGSPWPTWWIPTLEVMNELGGADESSRGDVAVMTAALADPTVWVHREVLHACWGRRPSG